MERKRLLLAEWRRKAKFSSWVGLLNERRVNAAFRFVPC